LSQAATLSPPDIDFVLDIPTLGNDLLTRLDNMRAADPIFWSEKNGAWMITGHAEVAEGYYGGLPLSNVRLPHLAVAHVPEEERYKRFPEVMEAPKTWLLNMDDPEHQRLRRLMTKAFSKPVVETLRPSVQQYIDETLDAAAQIDGPFDFVAKIGRIIPARVILKQLGLSNDLIPKLHRWSFMLNSVGGINIPV
jgi:cytochrome P450